MEISIKEFDSKGYAIALEHDERAGAMTYSVAGETLIIIDHTEVAPTFAGKGVGKALLQEIVHMAREKGIKIIPLCPFAASVFRKTPELTDVLQA